MSIRKLRAGRVSTATAETYVGEYGIIFYDEILGTLRISDGATVGGNPLTLVSEDFNFTFGDFIATTEPGDGASLSSVNENQDVNIKSNGTGSVNIVGDFHVHADELGGLSSPSIFNVKSDGQIRMLVPGADSTEGAVAIIGSLDGVQQPPVNTGVMLHVTGIEPQSGTPIPSRIYNDSLGTFGALVFRRYDNTALDPQAVGADQEIMRISSTAHDGSVIPGTANARIVFRTIDAQTTTNHSGKIELYAVASASTTLTKVMTADVANGVTANITTSSITANASTFNLANTTATTINFGGAADTINIGTAALTLNVGGGSGTVTVAGNLAVNGTMRYNGAQNNATSSGFNKTGGTVTANGRTGQLTTNADLLAKNTAGTFTVNNTYITSAKDVVIVNLASGGTVNSYAISVTSINSAGSFNVTVHNNGAGPLSEALVINFAILKVS